MVVGQSPATGCHERQQDERSKGYDQHRAAEVLHPLSERETSARSSDDRSYQHDTGQRGHPFVFVHPVGARADGIGDVLLNNQTDARHHQNAEDPKIPRDHERKKITECDLGPLIQASFERRQAIEVNDHCGQRQIEGGDRDQPEGHL